MLVVDDEPFVIAIITELLDPVFSCSPALSFDVARRLVEEGGPFAGASLDVRLPGGDGLDLVPILRRRFVAVPILVLTAFNEDEVADRARRLEVGYATKSAIEDAVVAFGRQMLLAEQELGARLERVARQFGSAVGVSVREMEALALALGDVRRDEIPERMGLSKRSMRKVVGTLMKKAQTSSLGDLVCRLRASSKPPPPAR